MAKSRLRLPLGLCVSVFAHGSPLEIGTQDTKETFISTSAGKDAYNILDEGTRDIHAMFDMILTVLRNVDKDAESLRKSMELDNHERTNGAASSHRIKHFSNTSST